MKTFTVINRAFIKTFTVINRAFMKTFTVIKKFNRQLTVTMNNEENL